MDHPEADRKRPPYDLPYGAYAAIARRLRPKVSLTHVRLVALGERRSPRVESAIRNYLARHEAVEGVDVVSVHGKAV